MPIADLRPARLDVRFRPNDVAVLRFHGPAGWLASRTFTAVLSNTALTVTEDTDILVVTASAAITASFPVTGGAVGWVLSESGSNDVIVGTWAPYDDGQTTPVLDLDVSLNGIDIDLVAPWAIEARLEDLEAVDISDGGDANDWSS